MPDYRGVRKRDAVLQRSRLHGIDVIYARVTMLIGTMINSEFLSSLVVLGGTPTLDVASPPAISLEMTRDD